MSSERLDRYLGRSILVLTAQQEWKLGLLHKDGGAYHIAGASVKLTGCLRAYAIQKTPVFGSFRTCHIRMERTEQDGARRWLPVWIEPVEVVYLGERTIYNGSVSVHKKWFTTDTKEFTRTGRLNVSLVCANHYTNPFYTLLLEEGSII